MLPPSLQRDCLTASPCQALSWVESYRQPVPLSTPHVPVQDGSAATGDATPSALRSQRPALPATRNQQTHSLRKPVNTVFRYYRLMLGCSKEPHQRVNTDAQAELQCSECPRQLGCGRTRFFNSSSLGKPGNWVIKGEPKATGHPETPLTTECTPTELLRNCPEPVPRSESEPGQFRNIRDANREVYGSRRPWSISNVNS